MARRKPPEVSVDIFNFLGVIKNVLGVLMVIIIGLALGAAESGSDGGGGFSSEEMAALAKEAQEQTKKEEAKENKLKGLKKFNRKDGGEKLDIDDFI